MTTLHEYRNQLISAFPLLPLILAVTACGGGGGTGSSDPIVETPPAVVDSTAPTISLLGDAELHIEQGSTFSDPGASANDDNDGEVTVVITGEVDTTIAATYTLTYSASDEAGNESSVERVVIVADTTAPTVTLSGSGSMTLAADASYNEAGATASDQVDGTLDVTIAGSVGSAAGTYTLTYTATDKAGNVAEVQRVVTVLEPEPVSPPTGNNGEADDLLVMTNGVVDAAWDRGINAFDQAIGFGDCSNDGGQGCPSIAWEFVSDPERGDVLQVTHADNQNLAGLFFASSTAVDISNYANGSIAFDIKVVSGDASITMKLDCFHPCSSGDQPLGERGVAGWETVSVPLAQLTSSGLKLPEVNTGLVIWASKFQGTVFQIDNIRFNGFDETAEAPPSAVTVPFKLTTMGLGSYSDTINPDSYRCVFDFGNWIYNAGVVEPGIPFCDTATGKPQGNPTPKFPQLAGAAAQKPTMTHRWWGSVSFIGEMRIGDPNGAGYITPDPIMARLTERGARLMGIPPGIRANAGGFGYAVPDPFAEVFDGAAIANSAHSNMDVKLLDHSEGAITAGWYEGDTLIMEATFVYGSPYVFFEVHSGTPTLKTLRANSGERGVWHQGEDSLGVWTNVAGQRNDFLIVGDAGTTFSGVDTDTVTISAPGNSFTLVWTPETTESVRQLLQSHARNKVKQVTIDYSVDRATNTVTVSHRYLSESSESVQTLAGLMPLHWKRSSGLDYATSARSARGVIQFAATEGFDYDLPYVGVLPALPLIDGSLNEAELSSLVEDFVAGGSSYWNTANDTYWNGKAVGRLSEVLAIADQLGMTSEVNTLRTWLKGELADWMSAERDGTLDNENYFVYDSNWSTLLGLEESFASHQQLNDHHFHYGYFIRAAAEVCRVDKAFCSDAQYGQMFELLIRDYAGGKNDPLFPYLRNFDPANGFSWASGHANFVRGNNNESTSEAANAYGAMVLYGLVTGNDAIVERGMYLHASTSATYWEYWNDIDGYRGGDAEARNFPADYPRITTSIIWGDGSAFSTWFSPAFAHILGIQGLPSNPLIMHVGLYADYLDDYVAWGLEESANGKPSGLPDGQWTDLWWNLWSMTNADAAIADYEATASYNPEEGEAPAHTYHWIYTMRALGELQTGTGTLTADYPAAMVFRTDAGVTNYVVYNYSDQPVTVTFSDGVVVEAAANQFSVQQM